MARPPLLLVLLVLLPLLGSIYIYIYKYSHVLSPLTPSFPFWDPKSLILVLWRVLYYTATDNTRGNVEKL